jgi:diguanylate cyclase (GGDEF)-like protein/PAS domain S-box-containing protein
MVYRCLNEPDWPEEYVSDYALELTGYPASAFIENPTLFGSLISEKDRQRIWDEVQEAVDRGERFRLRYAIHHKDGGLRFVEEFGQGVYDESGGVVAVEGLIYDVTEREQAEERLKEAEERYRTLVERVPAIVYVQEPGEPSRTTYVSPQNEAILGYSPEECIADPDHWVKIMHPDDRERVLAEDRRTNDCGDSFATEYRQFARDGRLVWLRDEATLVRGEGGEPLYWLGVQTDVTERKEAEEAVRRSEERLRSLADAAFEGILISDAGEILEANRALTDMFGYSLAELVGRSALEFVAPEHRDLVRRKIASGAEEPYEVIGVRKDGTRLDLEVRGRAYSYRGRDVRVTAVRDVTERKALEDRLRYQAYYDALTGLPNRQLFLDRLGRALARTRRRRDRRVALLFMDLDGFKVINDSLGHEVGDLLLVAVAARLKGCLRPEDTLARFGGDEFVVLVEDVEAADEAVRVAERIIDELKNRFVLGGRELYARTSIGIAIGEDRTKDPDDLLRDADTAMYRAKDEGLSYSVFEPTMYKKAIDRLEAENDLGRAVEQEQFVVHYQPIVSLQTGEVSAVEALVRWEHPQRGLLDPEEFVPMAEESGLVIPMGAQVLREACLRASEWQESHPRTPPLVMSVNLSARQLSRPDLAESVEGSPERDRACRELPHAGHYRDGLREGAGRQHGDPGPLEGARSEDLHRRLRYGILLVGLPQAPTR